MPREELQGSSEGLTSAGYIAFRYKHLQHQRVWLSKARFCQPILAFLASSSAMSSEHEVIDKGNGKSSEHEVIDKGNGKSKIFTVLPNVQTPVSDSA